MPAACLPNAMTYQQATVLENVPLARATYRVRLQTPEIAAQIVPGQFVMLRVPQRTDPLLGRAFALYDTFRDSGGQPAGIDLVYFVIGKMTGLMAELVAGDLVEIWGPLGNGFDALAAEHLMMVAGGIGQTPFLALAKESLGLARYGQAPRNPTVAKVSLCYGARTTDLLAGVDEFKNAGVEVHLATDDGTAGRHGLVTELVDAALDAPQPPDLLVGCGPEPMLAALADLFGRRGVRCLLSLETPMACGFGACFSCVVRVRQPGGTTDWRRTCIEGPIFDAATVEF